MTRKDFLSKVGIGAAFVLTSSCLGGCSKDNAALDAVDFTLDLNAPENIALLQNGGYLIKDQIVIAKNDTGEYVAATQVCSHNNLVEVIFKEDEFYCTAHGARFNQQGDGRNNNGSKGLKTYNVELSGNSLRIFS